MHPSRLMGNSRRPESHGLTTVPAPVSGVSALRATRALPGDTPRPPHFSTAVRKSRSSVFHTVLTALDIDAQMHDQALGNPHQASLSRSDAREALGRVNCWLDKLMRRGRHSAKCRNRQAGSRPDVCNVSPARILDDSSIHRHPQVSPGCESHHSLVRRNPLTLMNKDAL
jgi:hypothetical protein